MHIHHEGYPDAYEHDHDFDTTEEHMQTFHPGEPAFTGEDDPRYDDYDYDQADHDEEDRADMNFQGRKGDDDFDPEIDDPADFTDED